MLKYFLSRSDQGSHHCGGDHIASDLPVSLLNASLRQHERERQISLVTTYGTMLCSDTEGMVSFFQNEAWRSKIDFWGEGTR